MHRKFHKTVASLLSLGLLALTSTGSAELQESAPWAAHPLMSQCFATPQKFIQAFAGPEGTRDENIKIQPATPLTNGSTWVVDTTATTNHEWYLLEPGEDKKLCLTLFVPVAAQVTLAEKGTSLTAESKTQASPGFAEKQVLFTKPAGARAFSPACCREVTHTKAGASSSRKVPCATLFD
jgi:hypothetical protein